MGESSSFLLVAANPSYIISVITINDIGEGKIMPSTGQARFKCVYTAIVMKPFKGEVVDGKVVIVNKLGFLAMVGPLEVFVAYQVSTAGGYFS
jgi:DNA-directed RNA polymerase II subunit RPB7